MRRVVITGLGIVSSIGNNAEEVLAALKAGRSGITFNEAMAEHGFRSQIAGAVDLDVSEHVDKRTLRFMGPGAAYAHIAMGQAIADAGLSCPGDISVTGFNDMPFVDRLTPPLTTVRLPIRDMGKAAAELLILKFTQRGETKPIAFTPEIVERNSTAKPRKS